MKSDKCLKCWRWVRERHDRGARLDAYCRRHHDHIEGRLNLKPDPLSKG